MANNKLIFKNTIFLYLRAMMILLISLYSSRVLLRTLGIDDYGLYNVVAGFVSMLGVVNTVMVNSIQRFLNTALGEKDELKYNKIFSNAIIIQSGIALLILFFAETVGLWFLNNKLNIPLTRHYAAEVVYHLVVVSFVIKVLQAPFCAIVISRERMLFFAIQGVVESILLLGIVFVVDFVSYDKLIIYAILLLLVSIVVFIMNTIFARISYPSLQLSTKYCVYDLKKMLGFAGWNLFGSISGVLKSQGINMLLNMFFSVAVNAARGIAYQVLGAVLGMIGNFQTALNPQLIQSYAEKNYEQYKRLLYAGSKISFCLMWIISLPLILSMNQVLAVWIGEEFVPEYTALFTRIVLLTGLVDSLSSMIATGVYATGRMRNYQVITSLIILLILPISYIALKRGGAPEVAMYISLMVSIVAQIVRVVIWARMTGNSVMEYVYYIVLPLLLVVVTSYIPCHFLVNRLYVNSCILFVAITIVFTVVVNLVAIYMFGVTKTEREFINNKILLFLKRD
ncbi:MAG: hypothetical protein IKD24_08865 [Alistipes sp.]|nr:hypothetical protein [Alistipes sp.]